MKWDVGVVSRGLPHWKAPVSASSFQLSFWRCVPPETQPPVEAAARHVWHKRVFKGVVAYDVNHGTNNWSPIEKNDQINQNSLTDANSQHISRLGTIHPFIASKGGRVECTWPKNEVPYNEQAVNWRRNARRLHLSFDKIFCNKPVFVDFEKKRLQPTLRTLTVGV